MAATRSPDQHLAGTRPSPPKHPRTRSLSLTASWPLGDRRNAPPRAVSLRRAVAHAVGQLILGHSQLRQTQRYTHVTASLSQDAADRMAEALWG